MVFEASRTALERSIYPAALFVAAMFALVALGAFQWLSSRIAAAPDSAGKDSEESIDHHPTPEKEG